MADNDVKPDHEIKQPEQAHREGLEALDRVAHHATTGKTHEKVYEERLNVPHTPEIEHNGGRRPD
jgi:hypothetical protein